jgi:hypothetical protein
LLLESAYGMLVEHGEWELMLDEVNTFHMRRVLELKH